MLPTVVLAGPVGKFNSDGICNQVEQLNVENSRRSSITARIWCRHVAKCKFQSFFPLISDDQPFAVGHQSVTGQGPKSTPCPADTIETPLRKGVETVLKGPDVKNPGLQRGAVHYQGQNQTQVPCFFHHEAVVQK